MNDIFELHRGTAPLLVSLPHNGSAIPAPLAARMVERARQAEAPAAPPTDCVNALKRLRVDRQRADVQEQIDRLQAGDRLDDSALARLWAEKKALVRRLEDLKG